MNILRLVKKAIYIFLIKDLALAKFKNYRNPKLILIDNNSRKGMVKRMGTII